MDVRGRHIPEAHSAALYLIHRLGVPGANIYPQPFALDTILDVMMPRLTHLEIRGWRRVVFITSGFHAPRTRAIIEWVYSLPLYAARKDGGQHFDPRSDLRTARRRDELEVGVYHAPSRDCAGAHPSIDAFALGQWDGIRTVPYCYADGYKPSCAKEAPTFCLDDGDVEMKSATFSETLEFDRSGYSVTLMITPDGVPVNDPSLMARRSKEVHALKHLFTVMSAVKARSVADIHKWIYDKHGAYAAARIGAMHFKEADASAELRASYAPAHQTYYSDDASGSHHSMHGGGEN